jgi:hypothetical protein
MARNSIDSVLPVHLHMPSPSTGEGQGMVGAERV